MLACIDVFMSCLISHPIKARFDRAIQEQRQGVLEGNTTIDYLSLGYITTCHSTLILIVVSEPKCPTSMKASLGMPLE